MDLSQRPALLDEDDSFNLSKPFRVLDRLDCLAYHMSLAPPQREVSVDPPSVSISNSTTHFVENDDQCTAQPLKGPAPDFIHQLLPITIDFREGSPLWLAMKDSPQYFPFRSRLASRTMPSFSVPDRHEDDYLPIVNGSLTTLISLAAVLLVQLWIHDGANNDTQAFHTARDILLRLESTAAIRDPKCHPDHAIIGPKTGPKTKKTSRAMSYGFATAFAMLDRKHKSFADYNHQGSSTVPPFTSSTKDSLIQEIIDDGRPFCKIREAFIGNKLRNGKPYLGGWRVETLHLLAQMKIQSSRASSGLALFTSVYSFNRVASVEGNKLYVSQNFTSHLDKADREDPQTNRPFLELVLLFLVAAITKAYPQAVPPSRRKPYSLLFTPDVSHKEGKVLRLPVVYEHELERTT